MAVRTEKIILSLQDDATTPMARFAAATALANKELRDLSGTSTQASEGSEELSKSTEKVGDETEKTTKKTREYTLEMALADERSKRLRASLRDQASSLVDIETAVDRSGDAFRKNGADIDRFSGRLRLITDAVFSLGPGLIPIGAVGVPAVVALAAGLGAAGGALGVLLLGFNGLGDALDAIDTARLEPTVENLQAMRDELDNLGPAGADFARYLSALRPELESLQQIARKGMFPGFTDGIDDLLNRLPEVQNVIHELSRGLGDLGADAGAALASDRFSAFFDYLESEARPTMEAFARSTGNVVEGLTSLLVAFAPLTRDFTGGMESMSKSFADWAAGLSETDGFRDFTAYLRESGPQVLALLGSLGNAFVAIAKAAAPVGAVVVPALTALARLLTLIANSPIGAPLFTAAAGLIALNRAMSLGQAGFAKFGAGLDATTGGLTRMQKAAGLAGAALAGLAIVDAVQGSDKAAPSINALTNSLIALANTSTGSLPEDLDGLANSVDRLANPNAAQNLQDNISDALGGFGGGSELKNARTQIEALDLALAGIVNNHGAEAAAKTLEQLAKAAGLSESEVADLVSLMPTYSDAVAGAAGASVKFSGAMGVTGRAAGLTRAEVRGLTEAMEEQRNSALGAFDAVTQYANALIDARKQAAKSDAGIEISNDMTRKQKLEVIANREELSKLAGAWNSQGDAVRNNMGKWREARANFIETATAMGATAGQARRLANDLLEIPRQRVIDIKLYGSEKAADEIARIRNAVTSIPREWSTTYYVNQVNRLNKPRALPGSPDGSADGGSVPKTGLPYADRHPYLLADGEEVISNRHGQADRHRPLLKAINAGQLADGGTTGRSPKIGRPTFVIGAGADFGPMPRTVKGAIDEIMGLRGSLRDLRGEIKESAKEIKRETDKRDRLSEIVDKNQDALDALNGLFQDLASAVKANLSSDQFANVPGIANENPWGSSTPSTSDRLPTIDEVIARLNQDSANAGAMLTATETLRSKGVGDAALKSILEQGLETSQMFAALDPSKLQEYSNALGIRTYATDAAGAAAGNAVYGANIAAAEADLAESKAERREQTLAIKEMTAEARLLNRTQERAEKRLDQVRDELGDIKAEIKKARGDLESAARGRR